MKNSSCFITSKTILITGVTGTLGGAAARRFIQEGANVKGLIRSKQHKHELIKQGIEPVEGILEDYDRLKAALMDVDIVIHCAAYLGDDRQLAIRSNVEGVDNLARASLEAGVNHFIHISTTSVFGEPAEGYFDEDHPIVEESSRTLCSNQG